MLDAVARSYNNPKAFVVELEKYQKNEQFLKTLVTFASLNHEVTLAVPDIPSKRALDADLTSVFKGLPAARSKIEVTVAKPDRSEIRDAGFLKPLDVIAPYKIANRITRSESRLERIVVSDETSKGKKIDNLLPFTAGLLWALLLEKNEALFTLNGNLSFANPSLSENIEAFLTAASLAAQQVLKSA